MVFCIRAYKQLMSISFAVACIAVPLVAYGTGAAQAPTYAHDSDAVEVIYGSIASFDGRYALQVRDDRGFFDNVEMVQGTIINPTGQRLRADMRVAVRGPNRGFVLMAMQIDTSGVPPILSARPESAAPPHKIRPPAPNRERQRLQSERLQRYHEEQATYQLARAAYSHAEEVKARAAAQRLARKLVRLHGGQGAPAAFHRQRQPVSSFARIPPVRVPRHDIARTRVPPAKVIAPIPRIDPAIANGQSAPPWFGWGKL